MICVAGPAAVLRLMAVARDAPDTFDTEFVNPVALEPTDEPRASERTIEFVDVRCQPPMRIAASLPYKALPTSHTHHCRGGGGCICQTNHCQPLTQIAATLGLLATQITASLPANSLMIMMMRS